MTRIGLFLCLWLSLWSERVLGSILAIDYGADFIKASLMKPGQPFDVLLNRDSKRKIQSTVGWKRHDRLFGQDAANIVSACVPLYSVTYRVQNVPLLAWHAGMHHHSARDMVDCASVHLAFVTFRT